MSEDAGINNERLEKMAYGGEALCHQAASSFAAPAGYVAGSNGTEITIEGSHILTVFVPRTGVRLIVVLTDENRRKLAAILMAFDAKPHSSDYATRSRISRS